MQYKFPVIENIEQVLPAIAEKPEFIVAEREGYKVVNYMVNKADTFPEVTDTNSAILRECRGIKFYSDGKIAARPFHKFFNINERAEVSVNNINLVDPHYLMTKLDGSMIHPILLNGNIRWMSKMGITSVSEQVEYFVQNNTKYVEFAKWCLSESFTPIFEWCSTKQRIVVHYEEDQLILLAVRHMITGEYVSIYP